MKDKKLTKTVRFRCSETEYAKIARMSKPYGSFSQLFRECLFSEKRVFIDPKSFLERMNPLTTSINRVGNNINQIAKFLNTTGVNDYALMQQWFDAFAEYKSLLQEVQDEICKLYSY